MNRTYIDESRRRFLYAASAGSLLAVLGRTARADEPVRRIGFVDLNLENYHANVFLKAFRNELKDRGFTIAGATAVQVEAGRDWCKKNDVPWYDSVEELAKNVDVFAVLAPSNPETHLDLAKQTLPFRKPTFIDKTFAPNARIAAEIFALADKHGTPVQTASALRYTLVQDYVAKIGRDRVRHVTTFTPAGNYDEYIVHPVEMVVSCLGPEAVRLQRRSDSQILIDFSGGRTATINIHEKNRTPYAAMVTSDEASEYLPVNTEKLFVDAGAAMLEFFKTGKNDVDRRETMAIMRIMDAAKLPQARNGYVELS